MFTAARNALAKTVSGADAQRVKKLAKPTLVPWAVNQVYWKARATYDRLIKSGERLRKTQVAALEGRGADVREAADVHRRVLSEAVAEAMRHASSAGSDPGADALTRTFEAMSLAAAPPEQPGRLTQPLQPAGFEALAGITPVNVPGPPKGGHYDRHYDHNDNRHGDRHGDQSGRRVRLEADHDHGRKGDADRESSAAARKREAAEAKQRAERQQHEAALKKAEAALARAETAEQIARAAWDKSHDALLEARRALSALKSAARSS